jgi:PAS domain S-box-containing protein
VSLAHTQSNRFDENHLRQAELMAIPAAVAIQNARLYERTAIYAEELQKRLTVPAAVPAPSASPGAGHRLGLDTFEEVFLCGPIASCITTLHEGIFLAANRAFEERYGYSHQELVANLVNELEIWETAADRRRVMLELQKGHYAHNVVTRFRSKSGGTRLTAYSAVTVRIRGMLCVLATSAEPSPDGAADSN